MLQHMLWDSTQKMVCPFQTTMMNCLAPPSMHMPKVCESDRLQGVTHRSEILLNNIKTASSNQISSLRVVRQGGSTRHCLGGEAPRQGVPHWYRTKATMTEPHLPLLREKHTACQISASEALVDAGESVWLVFWAKRKRETVSHDLRLHTCISCDVSWKNLHSAFWYGLLHGLNLSPSRWYLIIKCDIN